MALLPGGRQEARARWLFFARTAYRDTSDLSYVRRVGPGKAFVNVSELTASPTA